MSTNNPLHQLILLEKDARAFGFDWPNKEMIIEQAISECSEIKEAIDNQEPSHRLQEEIGDLIHTAISLCLFAKFDPEETLAKSTAKFGKRMSALKELTKQRGLTNLKGKSIEYMIELWKEAKKSTQENGEHDEIIA